MRGDARVFDECLFAGTRRPLNEASNLPGLCYTSPEWYEREVRNIFLKEWLCAGRVEQVEKVGDFFTLNIAGEPVAVLRDQNLDIRAFLAVCRHRGAILLKDHGNCRAIVCPYHGWTYRLTGKLVGTPGRHRPMDDALAFDHEAHSLVSLRTAVWAGFIFINFDPAAGPLLSWLGDLPERLRNYRMADLRPVYTVAYDVDCNWKLYAENAIENYHVEFLHRKYMAPDNPYALELQRSGGPYDAWYNRYYLSAPSGAPLPEIEGLSEEQRRGVYQIQLRPNFHLITTPTTVKYMTMVPESLTRTRVSMTWCFPASTISRNDFEEIAKRDYYPTTEKIMIEDNEMTADLQKGMASRLRSPGRLSKHEGPLLDFENYILDKVLGGDRSAPAPRASA